MKNNSISQQLVSSPRANTPVNRNELECSHFLSEAKQLKEKGESELLKAHVLSFSKKLISNPKLATELLRDIDDEKERTSVYYKMSTYLHFDKYKLLYPGLQDTEFSTIVEADQLIRGAYVAIAAKAGMKQRANDSLYDSRENNPHKILPTPTLATLDAQEVFVYQQLINHGRILSQPTLTSAVHAYGHIASLLIRYAVESDISWLSSNGRIIENHLNQLRPYIDQAEAGDAFESAFMLTVPMAIEDERTIGLIADALDSREQREKCTKNAACIEKIATAVTCVIGAAVTGAVAATPVGWVLFATAAALSIATYGVSAQRRKAALEDRENFYESEAKKVGKFCGEISGAIADDVADHNFRLRQMKTARELQNTLSQSREEGRLALQNQTTRSPEEDEFLALLEQNPSLTQQPPDIFSEEQKAQLRRMGCTWGSSAKEDKALLALITTMNNAPVLSITAPPVVEEDHQPVLPITAPPEPTLFATSSTHQKEQEQQEPLSPTHKAGAST